MYRFVKSTGSKLFYTQCSDCGGSGYSFGGQCERCEGTGDEDY